MSIIKFTVENFDKFVEKLSNIARHPNIFISFSPPIISAYVYHQIESIAVLALGLSSLVYPAYILVWEYRITAQAVDFDIAGLRPSLSLVVYIFNFINLISKFIWFITLVFAIFVIMDSLDLDSTLNIAVLFFAMFLSIYIIFDHLVHILLLAQSEKRD